MSLKISVEIDDHDDFHRALGLLDGYVQRRLLMTKVATDGVAVDPIQQPDGPLIIYSPAGSGGNLYQVNLYTTSLAFNSSGTPSTVYIPRVQTVTAGSIQPNPLPVLHSIQTQGVSFSGGGGSPSLTSPLYFTTFTATLNGVPPFRFAVTSPAPSQTANPNDPSPISGTTCVTPDMEGGKPRVLKVQFSSSVMDTAYYVWRQISATCDAAGPLDLFLQYFSG